jgi:hypothetical protein
MRVTGNAYILVTKPEAERPLNILRHRCEDIIQTDLQQTRPACMD